MQRGELMNLCYSCLIDGTGEHNPITMEEAEYTIDGWQGDGIDIDGLTPEALMSAWNEVLAQLTPRKWRDIESGEIVTECELRAEFAALQAEDTTGEAGHRDITFDEYVDNCLTIHNGTLEEV